jgi:hypothetical protein
VTDEEFMAEYGGAPVDNLAKQRKRAGGAKRGKLTPATMGNEEFEAMYGDAEPPGAPSPTSSYSLNDYAGENKAGPYSQPQQDAAVRARAEANARLVEGGGPDDLMDGGTQEQRAYMRKNSGRAADERTEQAGQDFARFALGNVLGGVGTSALQRVGVRPGIAGAVGGAVGNAVPTASTGAPAREVAESAVLGGVLGGISGPRAEKKARTPGTQAEIDAATIAQFRREHPDPVLNQMQGTHETYRLAKEANDAIAARVGEREAANGRLLNTADADYSMLDADYPIPETSGAIERLQGIREQSYGGQGPMLGSDPVIQQMQRQLTIGKEATPMVPRDVLRTVQRNLSEEADFQSPRSTQASGALKQAAGVVADTARAADPRLGPGNLGGALDKFGAGKDALRNIDELRGPEGSRETKLARVGGGDQTSDPAVHKAESEVRALQEAEPAGNKLIDRIRYNNTVGRRSLKMPYIGYSQTGNIERGLRQNWSNLGFKLNQPKIDEAGMVAGRAGRYTNPLILPLELQLLMDQQQEDRR